MIKPDLIISSDKLPVCDKLYIGVDQSLTASSISLLYEQTVSVFQIHTHTKSVYRLDQIEKRFIEILNSVSEDHLPLAGIAIEGYSFGSQGRLFGLGELGGVLRLAIYRRNVNLIEVPPTTLKKFLAGIGNAKKELMIKELYKKYDVDVNDNNDCDAISLSIAAHDYFETELHPIKQYRIDLHKGASQIVGEHPNPLTIEEYTKDMSNDITVRDYEKLRRSKQK